MKQQEHRVYLSAGPDQTWCAVVLPDAFSANFIKLCPEQTYPVEVFYRRTDMNGSICHESDICSKREELVNCLNWLGACRFTLSHLWDFDVDKCQDRALVKLFDDAYARRAAFMREDMYDMFFDTDTPATNAQEISISEKDMQEMVTRADARLKKEAKAALQSLDAQIQIASSRATDVHASGNAKENDKDPERFPF